MSYLSLTKGQRSSSPEDETVDPYESDWSWWSPASQAGTGSSLAGPLRPEIAQKPVLPRKSYSDATSGEPFVRHMGWGSMSVSKFAPAPTRGCCSAHGIP